MKLQDQVCTLEQAKKLKELLDLGQWKNIDFNFYWLRTESSGTYFLTTGEKVGGYAYPVDQVPAFTVAELGLMLPSETLTIRRGSENSAFPIWEWENEGRQKGWGCFNTEAAARADHLIMLLENKLITVEEVNKRLK